MLTLSEYLRTTGISQRRFARRIGASTSYVCELVSGRKTPGLALASRIERATGGQVTAVSFVREDRISPTDVRQEDR